MPLLIVSEIANKVTQVRCSNGPVTAIFWSI